MKKIFLTLGILLIVFLIGSWSYIVLSKNGEIKLGDKKIQVIPSLLKETWPPRGFYLLIKTSGGLPKRVRGKVEDINLNEIVVNYLDGKINIELTTKTFILKSNSSPEPKLELLPSPAKNNIKKGDIVTVDCKPSIREGILVQADTIYLLVPPEK